MFKFFISLRFLGLVLIFQLKSSIMYMTMRKLQVPKGLVSQMGEALNKGNICIAKTSPPAVFKAYFDQFERDFTLFLKARAEELVSGGCMVLTTMGSINSDDPLCIWEVVGLKLNDMVLEVSKYLFSS